MSPEDRVEHVTCLGCGCGCDDVTITIRERTIVDASPVCPLGRAWFGDGQVPGQVLRGGQPVSLDQALETAAADLVRARGRCLIYLGSDLSSQAQRAVLEIADLLRGTVDSDTSDTAANGLLTAQRRGRAGATLGEIRNRGDVFLFWAVDPSERYPRFLTRYSLEPVGTHVPGGRRGREVIGVGVGADRTVSGADVTLELKPDEEITALSLLRAIVSGVEVPGSSPVASRMRDLAQRLMRARYAVLVHDAEPSGQARDPLRVEALTALAQALNGPTRAALCSLRSGGNRVGAEAMLTSQTGYPFAVDYSRGYPQYRPEARGISRLMSGLFETVLIAGSPPIDNAVATALSSVRTIAVGPRASQSAYTASVAIDTGVAGIHEGGTAYRMDEVPLRLRPPLTGPRPAVETLTALGRALRCALGTKRP